jgi:hypothetical protein
MAERSPDLWFSDGTIVLRAKDVLFRVYGGMLASKSSVFADMFQIAGAAGSDGIEGCPVVDLHDAPDELLHFLKALHDAQCVLPRSCDPHTLISCRYYSERTKEFRVVLSVLRLAIKYDAPYFRDHALATFSTQFPTTWDEWHRSCANLNMDLTRNQMAVQLVTLTAEIPLQYMLPSALLILSTGAPVINILDGTPFDDGTRIELPWPVKRQCLLGRSQLLSAQRAQLFPLLERFGAGAIKSKCAFKNRCRADALNFIKMLNKNSASEPLNLLKPRWGGFMFKTTDGGSRSLFCDRCSDVLAPLYHQQCALIWDKLPSYFDLPSWAELAQR